MWGPFRLPTLHVNSLQLGARVAPAFTASFNQAWRVDSGALSMEVDGLIIAPRFASLRRECVQSPDGLKRF